MNPFVAVSAIAPSMLLMWYFYKRDVFPEPGKVLWITFGLGVLTVFPVLLVAGPASLVVTEIPGSALNGFSTAFLLAAIPEEFFKFTVVWLYASRHVEFDEPMDGIVYGAVASLGFATFENVMYVAGGGTEVAILRAITAVPLHAFLGAIMGYFVGQARFAPEGKGRGMLWGLAIGVPILLHGLYDFPLLAMGHANEHGVSPGPLLFAALLIVPATLLFAWVYSVKQVRRLHAEQIALLAAHASAAVAPAAPPPPAPVVHNVETRLARAQARHAPPARSLAGWSLIWLGGLTASFGGLLALGVLLAFAIGTVPPDELVATVVGGVIIGGIPLVVGAVLFGMGIKKLNQGPPQRS